VTGELLCANRPDPGESGECTDQPGTNLPQIVHVSGDFPDPVEPDKTSVIRALLELTRRDFSHKVISLNRRSPDARALFARSGPDDPVDFDWGEAWLYRAPPHGIAHAAMLRRLGDRIAASLSVQRPALLMGHKLTIEGLAVARAAGKLRIPYGITIQGNTDARILAARPDLAPALARVFHEAAVVFSFAPWALAKVEQKLGRRAGPSLIVPCPTDLDTPLVPLGCGQGLLTAFHLRHHRNKNLRAIAAGMRDLRAKGERAGFALVGGGERGDIAACLKVLRGIDGVQLTGALGRKQLSEKLNQSTGFVMPSHRESYGLVFVEALFAGLPVIYPADRAIAGHFENAPFAIPVNPNDNREISAAMRRLLREEGRLKQHLADWQLSEHARQFKRPQIAAQFAAGLHTAISQQAG